MGSLTWGHRYQSDNCWDFYRYDIYPWQHQPFVRVKWTHPKHIEYPHLQTSEIEKAQVDKNTTSVFHPKSSFNITYISSISSVIKTIQYIIFRLDDTIIKCFNFWSLLYNSYPLYKWLIVKSSQTLLLLLCNIDMLYPF